MRRMESRDPQEPRASDVLWSDSVVHAAAGSMASSKRVRRDYTNSRQVFFLVALIVTAVYLDGRIKASYEPERLVQGVRGDWEVRR